MGLELMTLDQESCTLPTESARLPSLLKASESQLTAGRGERANTATLPCVSLNQQLYPKNSELQLLCSHLKIYLFDNPASSLIKILQLM